MNQDALTTLLRAVRDGSLPLDEALAQLRHFPCEDVGVALIDHHRELRQGVPEVIFGEGKSREQLATIVARMAERGGNILATRLDPDKGAELVAAHPAGSYDSVARTFTLLQRAPQALTGTVLVVCAGTSDLPVAREAVVTARVLGCVVEELVDVGVAGIHRLLSRSDKLREAAVIIVVAGMEGALPSVVGGLVAVPVIAVPTSIGYGAAFNGLAPLLGMLNSCAAGVTVVNIDNGFGAAAAAARILRARGAA